MYYARLLKFGAGLTKYPLPPWICVVDKNEALFAETKDYARFYAAKGDCYDWDCAPSTPCPRLVEDVLATFTGTTGVPPAGDGATGTTGVPPVGDGATGTTGVQPVEIVNGQDAR